MAETIKTKKIFLPVDEPDLENKHYKAVWEVAGEELEIGRASCRERV